MNDWEAFQELDKKCFPDSAITKESFKEGLSGITSLTLIMVQKETNEFIGYLKIAVLGFEGHIQRIAIDPGFQGKGYGSAILLKSIEHLRKAGCSKFFLYVLTDNEKAIILYKKNGFIIENNAWQFTVPFSSLPAKPRGMIQDIDWGEIMLLSLKFEFNPKRIEGYFSSPKHQVIKYLIAGKEIGFCRFTPSFPGAFPFVLRNLDYLYDFLAHLKELITEEDFSALKVTFDENKDLFEKFTEDGYEPTMELYRMSKKD
jgi:hypothetical protein